MLNLKDQLVVVLSRQGQNWNPFTLLRNLKPALIPSDQLGLRPLPAPHGHGHTSEEENEASGLISAALCCGEAQRACIILQGSSLLMGSIQVATIFLSFFPFYTAQHCLSLCSYTFHCNYRVLLPAERHELLNREEISQRLIEIQTCSIRRKFSVSLGVKV